jgi:hypothetical protein
MGAATQRRPSGLHSVDAVGLAVASAGLTIRAIDLDHRHSHSPQGPGQPSPVSAGALHPDPTQRAERGQPGVQLDEPRRRRRERLDAERPAVGIKRGGDVDIQMGVHPTGDRTRLYDGHNCHPFSVRGGTHVPGRRP